MTVAADLFLPAPVRNADPALRPTRTIFDRTRGVA
jgi:hypothetical protein